MDLFTNNDSVVTWNIPYTCYRLIFELYWPEGVQSFDTVYIDTLQARHLNRQKLEDFAYRVLEARRQGADVSLYSIERLTKEEVPGRLKLM